MQNDKQSGQQQGQRSQSQLDTIIRNGKWNSQSDANSYLQQHGLSCEMKDDGTAQIFDTQSGTNKPVATVRFQGSGGQAQRQISNIDY